MQQGLDELYGLGYMDDQSFPDRIEAVTLDDVIAVAKKYLGARLLVNASPAEK